MEWDMLYVLAGIRRRCFKRLCRTTNRIKDIEKDVTLYIAMLRKIAPRVDL